MVWIRVSYDGFFPIEHLRQFWELLFLLAFYIEYNDKNLTGEMDNLQHIPFYNTNIRAQIKEVIKEGHNAKVKNEYNALLRDKLGFNSNKEDVYGFLNDIYKQIRAQYNNNKEEIINTRGTIKQKIMVCYTQILGTPENRDLPKINKEFSHKIIENKPKTTWGTNVYNDNMRSLRNILDEVPQETDTREERAKTFLIDNLPEEMRGEYEELSDILGFAKDT